MEYAACRKCGDPIERPDARFSWCSLRGQPWPYSCSRPWWRFTAPHEPGDRILTGDAAKDAQLAYLSSGKRTERKPWRWQLRRVWEG